MTNDILCVWLSCIAILLSLLSLVAHYRSPCLLTGGATTALNLGVSESIRIPNAARPLVLGESARIRIIPSPEVPDGSILFTGPAGPIPIY